MDKKLLKLLGLLLVFGLVAAACSSGGDEDESSADDSGAEESGGEEGSDDETVDLAQGGGIVAAIKDRGSLNCGVSGSAVAFSVTQADGSQQGFDADYCRVVAAAVLGDANAVNFVPLTSDERFTAVQLGTVDVLMRNTTWTQSRDTDLGMDFGPTTYYDGQQLMARAGDGFSASSTMDDIDGAVICVQTGTTTEKNIADAADAAGATVTYNTFADSPPAVEAFIEGACDIYTTDGSALVGTKAEQQPADQEWVIFPSTPISKEPLGPTYGQNDSQFADVVNWAVYATFLADEYGVNSGNADEMAANPPNAEIGRLLGGEGELQGVMGLDADAFLNVIKQVGNYDEIFTRHLGPVGLTREGSANAQWTDGGLIYAPPAR